MKHGLVFVFVGLGCALLACEHVDSHIFTGRPYEAAAKCLGSYEPIEVADGDVADVTCPPYCVRADDRLFLTTVCPPLPTESTLVDGSDPECAAALVAPVCAGDEVSTAPPGADAASADDPDASH